MLASELKIELIARRVELGVEGEDLYPLRYQQLFTHPARLRRPTP